MKTNLRSLVLGAFLTSGVGIMAPWGTAEAGLPESDVRVEATFRYEAAAPRTVNGRPVLDHRFWSCVDTATVTFPTPMRIATVLGKVYAGNPYSAKRAPTLKSVASNLRTFTFGFAPESLCNDHRQMNRFIVSKEVRSLTGEQLAGDVEVALAFPPGRDSLAERLVHKEAYGEVTFDASQAALEAMPCGGSDPTACITVTPERLNAALIAMRSWIETESTRPLYRGADLKLMPLEHLLKPFSPVSRARHYGNSDLLYVLRRAARFTQMLFPELEAIPVADLSQPDGGTPRVDDILLHPAGSHEGGRDADVAYITTGAGDVRGARWHLERNFWFTYGILQSTGVDLVITAYKDELRDLAAMAHRQGLINSLAVGRFNTLMSDQTLNHDKHLHISVRNGSNASKSRMFSPTDDVYACYLGLRPSVAGGNFNYCGGA